MLVNDNKVLHIQLEQKNKDIIECQRMSALHLQENLNLNRQLMAQTKLVAELQQNLDELNPPNAEAATGNLIDLS